MNTTITVNIADLEKVKVNLAHYRKQIEQAAERENTLMRLLERANAERQQLKAEIAALKRQRIADRDAIAEYLRRAMSDFLQNTIKFQLRETPDSYVVEKEIVNAWWKAANTNYEDLDEDDKSLYICDADAIVSIVRVN
jgi:uncharacterized protein YdcH (DUF465 family)